MSKSARSAAASTESPLASTAAGSDPSAGVQAGNKRMHRRLDAGQLRWLRAVRLRFGPEARVIDVSAGGILIETAAPLKRHAHVVLEVERDDSTIVVPARVVRCHGTAVGDTLVYRAACAFSRPLAIPSVSDPQATIDESVSADAVVDPLAAVASWQKVIARFRDGTLLRGYTSDFHASRPQLHLSDHPYAASPLFVPVAQLKALFFVREFAGDPNYAEQRTFVGPSHGRKLEITFHDGEVLVGSTMTYRPAGLGFFVFPCDSRSNNQRVFVVAGAIRHMRFLS